MAGHPAAPQFIVPEGDILNDNAILNKNYNITLLARELVDTLTTIRWCARHRLLANSHMCPQCAVPCGLISRAQLTVPFKFAVHIDNKHRYSFFLSFFSLNNLRT